MMATNEYSVVLQTERGEERQEFAEARAALVHYTAVCSRTDLQFVRLYEGRRLADWEVTLSKEAGDRVLADATAAAALADLLQLPSSHRREFLAAASALRGRSNGS